MTTRYHQVTARLTQASDKKLEAICEATGLTKSGAINQAIHRWYHSDPVLRRSKKDAEEKKTNGHSDTSV